MRLLAPVEGTGSADAQLSQNARPAQWLHLSPTFGAPLRRGRLLRHDLIARCIGGREATASGWCRYGSAVWAIPKAQALGRATARCVAGP